jgi:hypothetical protein
MSKIVQAVNAMITNADFISDVRRGKDELFFLYKGKYTWSIKKINADFFIYFYPTANIDELIDAERSSSWEDVDMVVYRAGEIGTVEAKASFSELYTVLKEQEFGVNSVLDEIISDADLF